MARSDYRKIKKGYWRNKYSPVFVEIESPNHRHATYKVWIFEQPKTGKSKMIIDTETNSESEANEIVNDFMKEN